MKYGASLLKKKKTKTKQKPISHKIIAVLVALKCGFQMVYTQRKQRTVNWDLELDA